MRCAFSLEHYRELLASAREGGYRFVSFDAPPQPGDALLRHDVDLSLDAALRMAELESDEHATATYFLMTQSVFYNLASGEGGAVYPDAELDERFDAVVAWHNPDPEYMADPLEGAVNVMQEGYFDPPTYRSDSNQRWRSGCPHEELAAGAFPWLQLLTHPEIWAYPGSTMGQTMRAMLDAERERRLAQLAEDRIDLS